jgi:alkanesulfonate monooxygenase SsuD/methylene tetrahydromethanopterin reductase-like flavin-dependent oxidoreductase (luciferase family)
MRFGLSLLTSADRDVAEDAREAERLGFDMVTVMDHLPGERPTLETWTQLTWAAAATERILVAPNVLGLPYRHPAVTAKMAETLQRLSGGRLVLGMGAGGSDEEFRRFGLPVREPRVKIDALEEALRIIRALWSGAEASFGGEHYHVEGARIAPTPDPPIPVWLGVYGKRSTTFVARYADGWLPSMRFAPPERRKAMQERIRAIAEEDGRDPVEIEMAYNVGVRVDERAEQRPGMIAGDPSRVTEQLQALIDDGVTFLQLWAAGDQAEQRDRLAAEILPALRG